MKLIKASLWPSPLREGEVGEGTDPLEHGKRAASQLGTYVMLFSSTLP